MIVHLPKDLRYDCDPIPLPEEDPYLYLKPVEDGVFLYSLEGKLVGQSLFDEFGATVSVGDAKSYRVEWAGEKIAVRPFPDEDRACFYEPFGNVKGANYTLYEYRQGEKIPVVAARVTPEPLDPDYYYVKLSEESNVFRTLLLTVAASHVSQTPKPEGKKKK